MNLDCRFSSKDYNEALKQGKLAASKCQRCGAIYLPSRVICPECHGRNMEPVTVKGTGKLVAFTVISVPPPMMAEEGFDREHPYCSGVVELDEGVRVTARVLGADVGNPESIEIGTPVTLEFVSCTHEGEEKTFLAFRILRSSA